MDQGRVAMTEAEVLASPKWGVPVGPVTVGLIERGDRICAHLARGGTFEPRSLARWAEMCAGGGTVLDVGAYSGLFSIAAAKLGCHVHAFEPMPALIERHAANVGHNDLSPGTVVLHHAAASDRCGAVEFFFNPRVQGLTSGASMLYPSGGRGKAREVKAITIDSLALDDVRAVKIDVERHEAAVLRGARETLARCRPKLLVEALDEALTTAVLDELGDAYRLVERLDRRNLYLEPV